jgi:hypothetical protein
VCLYLHIRAHPERSLGGKADAWRSQAREAFDCCDEHSGLIRSGPMSRAVDCEVEAKKVLGAIKEVVKGSTCRATASQRRQGTVLWIVVLGA